MRRAYTLLEMVAVTAIMGLLAMAIVPFWTNSLARAREKEVKGDLIRFRQAINAFYRDTGCYPATMSQLSGTTLAANCLNSAGTSIAAPGDYRGPYMTDTKSTTVDTMLKINLSIASSSGYSVGSAYLTSTGSATDSEGRSYGSY